MTLSNTDRVRSAQAHRIASGDLPPGSAIDESLLCTFFRVSRTPVREALLQLAATGQVRIAPRAGIFVTQHTIEELEEMLETLALLEGACTQLAAYRISNAQIRELERLQKRGAKALQEKSLADYATYNAELHALIHSIAGNTFMVQQIEHLRRLTNPYRHRHLDQENRMEQSWHEHQALTQALAQRDGPSAMQAAASHVLSGAESLRRVAQAHPEKWEFDKRERYSWLNAQLNPLAGFYMRH
jgi:DNA-binding GntR family transcriptional regulator